MAVEVGVLGDLEVRSPQGEPVHLRPFERRVLAVLALESPRSVDAARLESLVWETPPPTARKALQTHVSRIRRAAAGDLVTTTEQGYRLEPDAVVDSALLADAVTATSGPARHDDLSARRSLLLDALGRWRGTPFAELDDVDGVRIARAHLQEQRRVLEDRLTECRLLLGEVEEAVLALERLVEEDPYRERRWALRMLALYRAGRRRDALAAFARAREVLGEGVGLEPGDELVRLERRLVADDPSLLAAAALDGPRPADPGRPAPVGGFAGRERELAWIDERADLGEADASALLVVEGVAGIGKSALGRVAAERAAERGALVAWAACEEEPARPLQPFEDVVAALVRELGLARVVELAGGHAPGLAAVLPGAERDGRPAAMGMAAALRHLLVAAARVRPLLVVLDDGHWAPPATRRFVAGLPTAGAGIAVLVLTRPTDEPDAWAAPEVRHLLLDPLDRKETAGVLGTVLGGADLDPEVVDDLWRRSGGHPLLLREVVGALRAQGALRAEEHRWRLDAAGSVPASVGEIVQARLADLGDAAARAVQAAAVLGPTFDPQLVGVLVPGADADAGLHAGRRAGLLVDVDAHGGADADGGVDAGAGPGRARPEGQLAFSHALTHRAVLDAVPEGRRIELHEEAGLALQADAASEPLEVARHLVAAAPLDLDRAVAAATLAGRAASDSYAHDLAADQHRAALALLTDAGRRRTAEGCDALTALGDAERLAGDDRCRRHLQEAADIAESLGDGDRLATAAWSLIQLGPTTRSGTTDEDAAAVAARALDMVRSPALRGRVAAAASLLHSMTDDPVRCRSLFQLASDEAHALGEDRVLADVLPYAYLALGAPEDLDARARAAEELDAVSRRLDDPITRFEALHLRFSVLLLRAEAGLDEALAEMEELAVRVDDPSRRWELGYTRAALTLLRGDPDGSELLAAEALAAGEEAFGERALAAYGANLLVARAAQGRLPEMAPLIDQVLVDQPSLAAWHAARAWVAAAEGDADRAAAEHDLVAADGFAALPRDFTWTASVHSLVTAAALVGDRGRAAAAMEVLAPCSGRMTWAGTVAFGPVDQALAEGAAAVGDHRAAWRHATLAAELSRRVDAPLHLAAAEATAAQATLTGGAPAP